MRKYLEYFPGDFDATVADKIKVENKPYVGFSKTQGVNFTIVPQKSEEDDVVDLTAPYVTFTAEEAGSTIGLVQLSTKQTLEYSTDTTTWNTFEKTTSIPLNKRGDKVYVRGMLSSNNTYSNYTKFKMTGKIAASGNCNALWNYQDLNAPLKAHCGLNMFNGCTSLTTAPELPATTLAASCYSNMFYGCTSLTTAPVLPATTLAEGCYSGMFSKCTSLTITPELPATTIAGYCYDSMFYGCTSLTTAPVLPATELAPYCYKSMFYGCSSLTTAPELPATELAEWCYRVMFYSCTNLIYIKCLATDISATNCTNNWLSGASSTGTFVKHPDMKNWPTSTDGIPSGWTVTNAVL